jgi:CRISPR-associated protein Csx14
MNNISSFVQIEIDPLNPAQVFACCGLLELMAAMNPRVLGSFKYDTRRFRNASFRLNSANKAAFSDILAALKKTKYEAIDGFSDGEAPVNLDIPGLCKLTLDWWMKPERNKKSSFKLWAGQQTTIKLVQDMLEADWGCLDHGVLEHRLPMSGRFGLDPRSAWNTLDFGSSPDRQKRKVYTYPATEMLAAIGLQGFRPRTTGNRHFSYQLWDQPLSLVTARAAVSGALPTTGCSVFTFKIKNRSGSYSSVTFAQPINSKGVKP